MGAAERSRQGGDDRIDQPTAAGGTIPVNAAVPTLSRTRLAWLAGGLATGLLAASLMGPALATAQAQSETDQPTRQISVNGTGRVFIEPDIADVQLGVTFQGDTAKEASDKAAEAMSAVLAALLEMGIPEKDIQTTQLSINPVYDWNDSPPNIEGWEASNIVTVTVRDVTMVGDVVDAATSAGATNVNGITFRVDDPKAAEAEARDAAVADARAKADQLAAAAGVTIVGVISISETSYNQPQPIFLEKAYAEEAMDSAAATPVQPGNVELSVQVFINYEFE
jgi:hypothetical protein